MNSAESGRWLRGFALIAAVLVGMAVLAPHQAIADPGSVEIQTATTPVTGKFRSITLAVTTPSDSASSTTEILATLPEGVGVGRLAARDFVFSSEIRTPVVRVEDETVTFLFDPALAPGTEFTVRFDRVETPEEAGQYSVDVEFRSDEAPLGGLALALDVASPNWYQRFFRWIETFTFIHLFFSPTIIWDALPFLWRGFQVAVIILAVSYSLGIPLGLLLAFMKMSKLAIFRWPATVYVDVVRGTPMLVQLLLVYFGITFLPFWPDLIRALGPLASWQFHNVEATQFFRACIVLSFNSAAYLAEIFRAGIQSIHKGQLEAARSLGMSLPKAMMYVIIPQTVRRVLPTMMSEFILLFKDTSILFAVGIFEITLQARTIQARTFNMSPYIAAAGFYLLLTVPLGRLVARLEEKLAIAETGRSPEKPTRRRRRLLAAERRTAAAQEPIPDQER